MPAPVQKQPKIDLISTTLIHPAHKPNETTVPLSILDATVTHYAPCAAVWFFDPNTSEPDGGVDSGWASTLQGSLKTTLSTFPHLAALWPPPCHFGAPTNPGVEFITARCELPLDEVAPSAAQRKSPGFKSWNLSCSARVFLPDLSKVPFNVQHPQKAAPPVSIQITQFGCGGIALGIRIAHSLADAQSLAVLMHRWSYEHSLLSNSKVSKTTTPLFPNGFFNSEYTVFNPQLLDTRAAGAIDARNPDETVLVKSRSLPSS
ncbi:transferase family-domain-containing protein [Aspergillus undulatus]|uniref:transferase family-domain-containing protein n=1 Tax=Aspergillus undulatus TaxID=1810928 RepID=UPI003CCCACE4